MITREILKNYCISFAFPSSLASLNISFACVQPDMYAMNDKKRASSAQRANIRYERETEKDECRHLTLLKYALSFEAYKLIETSILMVTNFFEPLVKGCSFCQFPLFSSRARRR